MNRTFGISAAIIALASIGVACGSNDQNGSPASDGGSSGAGGSAGATNGIFGVCEDRPNAPLEDVTGRWAYLDIQTSVVRSSFTDDIISQVISLMLVDQTQTGSDVVADAHWCDRYTHEPDAVVRSIVPRSFLEALEPLHWEGTYRQDASASWRYQTSPVFMIQGAVLEDLTDPDSIPTDADDPRVIDQDADGQPGMTIALQGLVDGYAYVVQWSRQQADGAPVSLDRIAGLLTYEYRQSILASEPAFVVDVVSDPTPAPDPCLSLFVMERVHDDADCAWLDEQRDALFPGLPAHE